MRLARLATASGPRSVVADGDHWVQIADPFGHGWCLLQFLGGGYDAIATAPA